MKIAFFNLFNEQIFEMLTFLINICVFKIILIQRAEKFFLELRFDNFSVDDEKIDHSEDLEDDSFLVIDVAGSLKGEKLLLFLVLTDVFLIKLQRKTIPAV